MEVKKIIFDSLIMFLRTVLTSEKYSKDIYFIVFKICPDLYEILNIEHLVIFLPLQYRTAINLTSELCF